MPVQEQETIQNASEQIEFRQIRIGEKVPTNNGKERPNKLNAPVIVYPVKVKIDREVHEAYSKDEDLMKAIRKSHGFADGGELRFVKVRFTTDNIDEIISVYRGMFRQNHKALCFSLLGNPKATRWFDTREKLGNNRLVILKEPEEVDCNDKCTWWDDDGKLCGWRARVSMQLEDRPWIVAATRFRTSGWYVILHLRASLNRLKALTGGVLANIPFVLIEYQKDTFSKKLNKTQTHPVMVFDFLGTLDMLRESAIRELESRRRLTAAIAGKPMEAGAMSTPPSGFVNTLVAPGSPLADEDVTGPGASAGEVVADVAGDDGDFVSFDDDTTSTATQSAPADDAATQAAMANAEAQENEIAEIVGKLGLTERALEGLFDKHDGDVSRVLQDLRAQVGVDAKPSGEPAPRATVTPADDSIMDQDWGPGEESEEPSENNTPKPGAVTSENGTKVSPAEPASTAPTSNSQASEDMTREFDDFEVFDA